MNPRDSFVPGFTLRSVTATVVTLLTVGMVIQFTGVTDRWATNAGAESLPVPAMMVVLALMLVSGALYALTRFRLLTRAEMLCVLYASLMAAPLMTHGFWRTMLANMASVPRGALFDKLDALSPSLWPHGPNLVTGALAAKADPRLSSHGDVTWRDVEVNERERATVAVVTNTRPDETSWVRIALPVSQVKCGTPYLLAVLARARTLGSQARYYCRLYYDDQPQFGQEAFTSRTEEKRDFVQRRGFVRTGKYGVVVPFEARAKVALEFGLSGEGTVEWHDAQLMDVSALEGAYSGRRIIGAADYARLPPEQRVALIVRPDNLFSIEGLKFVAAGYYPIAAWVRPVSVWASFILLVLAGTFGIGVIMRRQWVQNERYPLPLAQIPLALLGGGDDEHRALPAIWRSPFMWAGLGIGLFWCIVRIGHGFNAAVPNLDIGVPIKPYLSDPAWGKTWDGVTFSVYALFLGLALYMELNVLISLVVGFLLFRLQFWFGETYGLVKIQDYPFGGQQIMASLVVYALLVLVFTRKHLWRVLKAAVKGENTECSTEALSYRMALIVLVGSVAGAVVWARWSGLPVRSMTVLFAYLLCIGFVAMKLRAECGMLHSNFLQPPVSAPGNVLLAFLPALGGLPFFGPQGAVFLVLLSGVMGYYFCFFSLPGMQLELTEVGRRVQVKPRHTAYVAILGVVGGIVVGGWVYLTSLYSLGADNYPLKAAHFTEATSNFNEYNLAHLTATETYLAAEAGHAVPHPVEPRVGGVVFAAVVTAIVTGLRQLFAGFWFHPIGFIIGASETMNRVWGSALLAWLLRFMVLRLGGAVTVREKLLPFAAGLVLAAIIAFCVCTVANGLAFFYDPGAAKFSGEFF